MSDLQIVLGKSDKETAADLRVRMLAALEPVVANVSLAVKARMAKQGYDYHG